jgi:hypothetical protein
MLGEIYKLVIPIYEFHRDYEVCNPDCKFFHNYNGHAPETAKIETNKTN